MSPSHINLHGLVTSTAPDLVNPQGLVRRVFRPHRHLVLPSVGVPWNVPGVVKSLSFVGKVVVTKVPAGVCPPIGRFPDSAGIWAIGGQTPAENLMHTTFSSQIQLFHGPGKIRDVRLDLASRSESEWM